MEQKKITDNIFRAFVKNRLLGIYTLFISLNQGVEKSRFEDCWNLLKKTRENLELSEREEKLIKERESLLLLRCGILNQLEGNYDIAKKAYCKGLAIQRELKNRDGIGQFSIALALLDKEMAGGKRGLSWQHLENDIDKALAHPAAFLAHFLDDESWLVRREAIHALAEIGEIEPVTGALGHENLQTRIDAICALEKTADKQTANRLIEILQDERENWFLRWRAAIILGKIQCKEAIQLLINKALWDRAAFVRASAFEALGMLADKDTIASLIPGLDDSDPDVRTSVVQVLGNIGNEDVIPYLEKTENGVDSIGRSLPKEVEIAIRKIERRRQKPQDR